MWRGHSCPRDDGAITTLARPAVRWDHGATGVLARPAAEGRGGDKLAGAPHIALLAMSGIPQPELGYLSRLTIERPVFLAQDYNS